MKKAIFASILMLATLTACQNETTEIPTPVNYEAKANVKYSAREGEQSDPFAKDGKIHIAILSDGLPYAIFDGEFLEKSKSEEAIEAMQAFSESQMARAQVVCSHHYGGGMSVGFVNVNGGYWMVYIAASGNEYAWRVPKPSFVDCAMVTLGIYDFDIPAGHY